MKSHPTKELKWAETFGTIWLYFNARIYPANVRPTDSDLLRDNAKSGNCGISLRLEHRAQLSHRTDSTETRVESPLKGFVFCKTASSARSDVPGTQLHHRRWRYLPKWAVTYSMRSDPQGRAHSRHEGGFNSPSRVGIFTKQHAIDRLAQPKISSLLGGTDEDD